MHAVRRLLNADQIQEFKKNGVIVLRGFYDSRKDILPIQQGIYHIIGILIKKYNLPIARPEFSAETFDAGYPQIIEANRRFGGEIYDAVKQIPAFIRLVTHPDHELVFSQLRPSSLPGLAAGGFGIRIDNPHEDRFRANWHQEYPAQLRSPNGLVYWSPLLTLTAEMGPVVICPGSQAEGCIPVYTKDPNNAEKSGAYALTLQGESELLLKYDQISPLTSTGDLIIMDFLVLHASGYNRSDRSRWSMQFRYFDYQDPVGQSHGWRGSYASGVDFQSIHPELCADKT